MEKTVVVGMSGGVDSSVSALLLKEQGYRVIGLFMKNWEETTPSGLCASTADFDDVARTADHLQIPYYSVNFVNEYRDGVFSQFLTDLKAGLTPNPDVLCNKEIKFKVFLAKALSLGADFLATGHYCRLDAEHRLLKGLDATKDQSYFLHSVESDSFKKVLFPIGHLLKKEVREIAREKKLPTAEKKESMGICFIGKKDFKPFVATYLGYSEGPLKTLKGQTVGTHSGIAYYTIGQRQGIGLGGEGAPWYVVAKDLSTNTVFVERGKDHPALFAKELIASQLIWQSAPPSFPHRSTAKIRYRQQDQSCTLFQEGDTLRVVFDEPQRAVTSGQSIVFYQGDLCLGGGIIH